MHHQIPDHSDVISTSVYGLILTTPTLARRLIPQGLVPSPYEVLDYTANITLHDPEGLHATVERTERIRFLQDGVSAILDHAWGDGVVLTAYQTDAGQIERTLRDDGKRHLLIGLKRRMRRGEVFEFKVVRKLVAAVTENQEWLETVIDHPVRQFTCNLIFPKSRPCRSASLVVGTGNTVIPVIKGSDGRTLIHFHQTAPSPLLPYILQWSW